MPASKRRAHGAVPYGLRDTELSRNAAFHQYRHNMEEKWITVQIAPVAAPGLLAHNTLVVAFLLQRSEDDPDVTRAVAAVLEGGILCPAVGVTNHYEGEWRLPD